MNYRPLLATWLLLQLLLLGSVGATLIASGLLQQAFSLLCAVAIAGFIMAQFMGLRSAASVVRLFALGGLFWLALLFLLTILEVISR